MNYEEKVEFLKGYKYAGLTIKGLEAEKKHWQDYGVDIAQKYSGMPITPGGTDGKVSKSATGTVSVSEQIETELERAAQEREKVKAVIDSVGNRRCRIVLYLHHVSCMSFGAIADELGKSERNVYKVYKKAVNELEI